MIWTLTAVIADTSAAAIAQKCTYAYRSATVYRARCKDCGRIVAIKALDLESLSSPLEDIMHEAQTMKVRVCVHAYTPSNSSSSSPCHLLRWCLGFLPFDIMGIFSLPPLPPQTIAAPHNRRTSMTPFCRCTAPLLLESSSGW
jgi:hypothetical protein